MVSHRISCTLRVATSNARSYFSDILDNLKPDLVIYDVHQSWTAALTSVHNIPAIKFSTTAVATFAYSCYIVMNPGQEYPFPGLKLSTFDDARSRRSIDSAISDRLEADPQDGRPNRFCDGIILAKTSREIEGKYIDYLSDLTMMKILPVSVLFQVPAQNGDDQVDDHELIKWLRTKSERSSVFVSFGSEHFLTVEEMEEIAFGLELSNVNFIWVVRFPTGKEMRADEALPKGFLERVKDRGRIMERWAPQAGDFRASEYARFREPLRLPTQASLRQNYSDG